MDPAGVLRPKNFLYVLPPSFSNPGYGPACAPL